MIALLRIHEHIKDKNDPLAGYTKKYSQTGFTKNNKDLVMEFAEDIVIKWEREHKKRLLDFGIKMTGDYIWGNLYAGYLNYIGKENDWRFLWYFRIFNGSS